MKISQADGARLMAAHEKAVAASKHETAARYLSSKAAATGLRAYRAAERAFAELVAQLTENEGL